MSTFYVPGSGYRSLTGMNKIERDKWLSIFQDEFLMVQQTQAMIMGVGREFVGTQVMEPE